MRMFPIIILMYLDLFFGCKNRMRENAFVRLEYFYFDDGYRFYLLLKARFPLFLEGFALRDVAF